jgi:hypothetical protein
VSDIATQETRPRRSWFERFIGVIAELQTWKNFAYLLLAFPLGLFYFVFLVVGLAVGIALVIIWVGLPILAVTVIAWWAFAAFERLQAQGLLGVRMHSPSAPLVGDETWWQKTKRHLSEARTWKDLAFLFMKFPLGVVSFVIVVVATAVPAALIGAPFYYRYVDSTTNSISHQGVNLAIGHQGINLGAWHIDSLPEALLLVPIGIVALFAALHLVNAFAKLSAVLAVALLDEPAAPQPATPVTPPAPTPPAPTPPASTTPSPQPSTAQPQDTAAGGSRAAAEAFASWPSGLPPAATAAPGVKPHAEVAAFRGPEPLTRPPAVPRAPQPPAQPPAPSHPGGAPEADRR